MAGLENTLCREPFIMCNLEATERLRIAVHALNLRLVSRLQQRRGSSDVKLMLHASSPFDVGLGDSCMMSTLLVTVNMESAPSGCKPPQIQRYSLRPCRNYCRNAERQDPPSLRSLTARCVTKCDSTGQMTGENKGLE
jgi:hypothetical protein